MPHQKTFTIKKNFEFQYKPPGIKRLLINKILKKEAKNWRFTLDNDLIINKGFVAILGESGSGKSTLVSILSGFEKLSRFQKENIYYYTEKENHINYNNTLFNKSKNNYFGYIFQRCYEAKSLSAKNNIALPLFIQKYGKQYISNFCRNLLDVLNLLEISESPANELSGGQLTRIGILRGIAQNPKVLFADEPANNLDANNAEKIMDTLKQWQQQADGTVIMVTHHLDHALSYADQIIIFNPGEDESSGHVAYNIEKNGEHWKDEEIQTIKTNLNLKNNVKQIFPESVAPQKKYNNFPFLTHVAYKNITSKADGSRSISLITFTAFLVLFFILFAGNQVLNWFFTVDGLKNNTDYLRRFEITVQHPPGLSHEVRAVIEQVKTGTVRKWLQDKIIQDLEKISEISDRQHFLSFEHFLCDKELNFCHVPLNQLLNNNNIKNNVLNLMQDFSRYLTLSIQKNFLNTNINVKRVKLACQYLRILIRRTEFLEEMSYLPDNKQVASVFPRWESGPEFVKKNGLRMNRTTTTRWLLYNDPFFDSPEFKYIVNANFRFKSNKDVGIIIGKETLIDEMGYSLDDNEVKVLYGTGEEACVPVRAVVERMPEPDRYKILTTFGFGERIRASDYHCEENKRYTDIQLKINSRNVFDTKWNIFDHNKNKDEYNNKILHRTIIGNNTFKIYCSEIKNAKTKKQWHQWVSSLLLQKEQIPYELTCDETDELINAKEIEPPYVSGTVYVYSKDIVRAMGEYLSVAYRERDDHKWRITAYDYDNKIKFAKQSEEMLGSIKSVGFTVFGLLFFLFLSTNMIINIRNKAPEIAIFRAMGASIISIIYIFNMQILMIVISAISSALLMLPVITPYLQNIFIENIIYQIWNNIDKQREAIVLISNNSFFEQFKTLLSTNSGIIIMSMFCVIITVSMMLLWVRFSPNYSISKILKER